MTQTEFWVNVTYAMQNKMLILWLFSEACVQADLMDDAPSPAHKIQYADNLEKVLGDLRLLLTYLTDEELTEIGHRMKLLKYNYTFFRVRVWPDR